MKLPIYQVDAFTSHLFGGNPAAVVLFEEWLPDGTLQGIAAENNLSETAFIVPQEGHFGLRWFTPVMEVDLCGHATLASAHVLFGAGMIEGDAIRFESQSGTLTVTRENGLLWLDFPSRKPEPVDCTDELIAALRARPREALASRDLMAVFETEEEVAALDPDFQRIARLDAFSVMITAPGDDADFVSRFFAPKAGILEDPVTGSAHCTLIPYWSERLGKKRLHAFQLSRRKGEIFCEDRGERVRIGGRAVQYLKGEIDLP